MAGLAGTGGSNGGCQRRRSIVTLLPSRQRQLTTALARGAQMHVLRKGGGATMRVAWHQFDHENLSLGADSLCNSPYRTSMHCIRGVKFAMRHCVRVWVSRLLH